MNRVTKNKRIKGQIRNSIDMLQICPFMRFENLLQSFFVTILFLLQIIDKCHDINKEEFLPFCER